MNTLPRTHPTLVATQTFDSLDAVMGDTDHFDLDGTVIQRTAGKVACLTIQSPIGYIDLSQDPTGELVDGIIRPVVYTPHDDERDYILGSPRQFPLTEEDSQFVADVVKAIKSRRKK
jgi:hypothetical protein